MSGPVVCDSYRHVRHQRCPQKNAKRNVRHEICRQKKQKRNVPHKIWRTFLVAVFFAVISCGGHFCTTRTQLALVGQLSYYHTKLLTSTTYRPVLDLISWVLMLTFYALLQRKNSVHIRYLKHPITKNKSVNMRQCPVYIDDGIWYLII